MMNDEVRPTAEDEAPGDDLPTGEESAAQAPEAGEAADAAPDGDALDPAAALEAAQAELSELRDAALRAQAEVENIRRRTQREVENANRFALEKFAGALLPVADSLEKSVEAVDAHEGNGTEDDALAAIKEGIGLSQRMFADTVGKFGIERVYPLGEPFDPERHEAMTMIEAPHAEPNSVVDVLQAGYLLNGRLLRAAMVVVAKG